MKHVVFICAVLCGVAAVRIGGLYGLVPLTAALTLASLYGLMDSESTR